MNVSSMVDDEGVKAAWMRLPRLNVVVLAERGCSTRMWAHIRIGWAEHTEKRGAFDEL